MIKYSRDDVGNLLRFGNIEQGTKGIVSGTMCMYVKKTTYSYSFLQIFATIY